MLYRNRTCQLMSQNFKLMQEEYMRNNLKGDSISVLTPLSHMFTLNPDMMYQFASEAYKVFSLNGLCKESDFSSCYEQLAIYGVLMSNLVFCYNAQQDRMALYTASYNILVQLASKGILRGKRKPIAEEMGTIKEVLLGGARISNSIKKGNVFQAVRLDWEYKENKLILHPTIPRSQLVIRDEYIIPYTALDAAMRMLNDELQTKCLKITSGDKVRVVTKNPAILNMIYGEIRTNSLLSYTYDSRANMFYVPRVGASIYSNGVTNIDLVKIDKIQVVNLMDIDLSEVNMDVSSAPEYCESHLGTLSDAQLQDLAVRLELDGVSANRDSMIFMLSEILYATNPVKLYEIMKETGYFNVEEFKKLPSKWGSADGAKQVEIPPTAQELDQLLKQGIFKVTVLTREGKYVPMVVTNCMTELRRIYGDDYYARFESEGNRLRMVDRILKKLSETTESLSADELMRTASKWNLPTLLYAVQQICQGVENYPISSIREAILRLQRSVDERKTVLKQPSIVTVRSCECKPDTDATWGYYRNIDIRAVRSIIQITSVNQ